MKSPIILFLLLLPSVSFALNYSLGNQSLNLNSPSYSLISAENFIMDSETYSLFYSTEIKNETVAIPEPFVLMLIICFFIFINFSRGKTMKKLFLFFLFALFGTSQIFAEKLSVPQLIPFNTTVQINGTNVDGNVMFKFAVIDENESSNYWSNDGSVIGEPAATITVTSENGRCSFNLGDTNIENMTELPAAVFATKEKLLLRVWLDAGEGLEQLEPDAEFAAAPYSLNSALLDGKSADYFISTSDFQTAFFDEKTARENLANSLSNSITELSTQTSSNLENEANLRISSDIILSSETAKVIFDLQTEITNRISADEQIYSTITSATNELATSINLNISTNYLKLSGGKLTGDLIMKSNIYIKGENFGGDVNIKGGDRDGFTWEAAGDVKITGGRAIYNSGKVIITGGEAGSGTLAAGGDVLISGGESIALPGNIIISGGNSSGAYSYCKAGDVKILAGRGLIKGYPDNSIPGDIYIKAGSTTYKGGNITISAGKPYGGTSDEGGNITILAGKASGKGGNIIIKSGDGYYKGKVYISDVAYPSNSTDAVNKEYVDNKQFSSANISDGAITSAKIQDNSITLNDLNTSSVDARYVNKSGDMMDGSLNVNIASGFGVKLTDANNNPSQTKAGLYLSSTTGDGQLYLYNGSGVLKTFLNSGGDSYVLGGRFGIGTAPAYGQLQIKPIVADANHGIVLYNDNGSTARMFLQTDGNGDYNWHFTRTANMAKGMTIDKNGNIGIGTTAPQEKLHVAGDVKVDGTISVPSNWVIGAGNSTQVIAVNNNAANIIQADYSGWNADSCTVSHNLNISGDYIVIITPRQIVSANYAVTAYNSNNFVLTKDGGSTFAFNYLIIKK